MNDDETLGEMRDRLRREIAELIDPDERARLDAVMDQLDAKLTDERDRRITDHFSQE